MSDGKTKKELLVQSRWFLLAVALLTTLVLSITYWLVQPEIPDFGRPAKLFAVTFFVALFTHGYRIEFQPFTEFWSYE